MPNIELFTATVAHPGTAASSARRAEDAGWTGLTFTDSQNLSGDPYVAMTIAAGATTTLKLATGVTNPVTRHPAVTSSAITHVNVESGGRAELGIGRGDSALAHIGLAPAPVDDFAAYLRMLSRYLRGEAVAMDEAAWRSSHRLGPALPLHEAPSDSRLRWVRGFREDTAVPVCAVGSGPRVIRVAAELADRVVLAVGTSPERVRWGLGVARSVNPALAAGAYVNVVVHDDVREGAALAAGSITSFARFSVMHGTVTGPVSDADRATLERLSGEYEMGKHFRSANPAAHNAQDLAVSFAIIGPPGHCVERLLELAELGLDRFYVVGPALDTDREAAAAATARFTDEVLPKLV